LSRRRASAGAPRGAGGRSLATGVEGVDVKKWLVCMVCGWLGAGAAAAKTEWFTVVGNPQDPNVNTVEIDPVVAATPDVRKNMYVRVNRSRSRVNWENLPYRSYEARIAFDCAAKKADFVIVTFYPEPLWTGFPVITTDYSDKPRPMELRDIEPNPLERIIRAACKPAGS
jgi:surface-adhesin protein E